MESQPQNPEELSPMRIEEILEHLNPFSPVGLTNSRPVHPFFIKEVACQVEKC